jgi:hypothetical protein
VEIDGAAFEDGKLLGDRKEARHGRPLIALVAPRKWGFRPTTPSG